MTTFAPMPFRERLEKTAFIVRGKAGKTYSTKPLGSDSIVSITDIELTEVLKGDVGAKALQVSQPGGEYRGTITHVEGVAKFAEGDDVVLFLAPGERGVYSIPSLGLGQYAVTLDDQGREILSGVGYPQGEKPWALADVRAALGLKKKSEAAPGSPKPEVTPNAQSPENSVATTVAEPEIPQAESAPSPWKGALLALIASLAIAWWWRSRRTKKPPPGGEG